MAKSEPLLPSGRGRPTLHDVARRAGVSTATAGRALGGYSRVNEEKVRKVKAAARDLGYRSNEVARSMISGRTRTIGVVGADITNPFFAGTMRGIGDVAREAGLGTVLTNSDEDLVTERDAVRLLLDKRVDGLIVAPADSREPGHLVEAIESGTPVVLLDRAARDLAADAVLADNANAGRSVVEHLLGLGHRRILVIAELAHRGEADWVRRAAAEGRIPRKAMNPTTQRIIGYLQAHRDAAVPVSPELIRATGGYSSEMAFEAAREALRTMPDATAVFTTDSHMTLGAYEALREAGVAIPGEVSFVGFDDIVWTRLVTPPLTVVSQPVYEMGRTAAERLLRRIEGLDEPLREITFPTTLVERASTARPGARVRSRRHPVEPHGRAGCTG